MTKNQETHWTCANRLKAEGGNAKCCDCDKHEGCGNPDNTIEEVIEKFGKMAFHTQQEAKEWLRQALEQVEKETRERDIEVVEKIKQKAYCNADEFGVHNKECDMGCWTVDEIIQALRNLDKL